jgi:hypothetical protein
MVEPETTMPAIDGWEWVLLVGGAYLAVINLVRLMNRRRDAILDEIRTQAELEARRQQFERAQQKYRRSRSQGRDQAA